MGIGEAIRRIRTERGMSQSALAKASGVAQTTISGLENGDQQSSKFLPRIANALGVPPGQLDPDLWSVPIESPPEEVDSIDEGALLDLLLGAFVALGLDETQALVLARAIVKASHRRRSEPSPHLDSDRTRSVGELLARAFRR